MNSCIGRRRSGRGRLIIIRIAVILNEAERSEGSRGYRASVINGRCGYRGILRFAQNDIRAKLLNNLMNRKKKLKFFLILGVIIVVGMVWLMLRAVYPDLKLTDKLFRREIAPRFGGGQIGGGEYRESSLGFSLAVPETANKAKLEASERTWNEIRFIEFSPSKGKDKTKVLEIMIVPAGVWSGKSEEEKAGYKELAQSNGNVYLKKAFGLSAEAETKLEESFRLTGEYGVRSVNVFFGQPGGECDAVVPVQKVIDHVPNYERAALLALLAGPTPEEAAQGYHSFFSEATKDALKGFKMENGTAYVNFFDLRNIIPSASASCGSVQFLKQVTETLTQFATIEKVMFAIDGQPSLFYDWLQYGCSADNFNCESGFFVNINR